MLLLGSNVIIVAANRINYSITSARFIAKERALVKWSQLQLFKAKERRGYLQKVLACTNTRVLLLYTAYASHASASNHVI